MKIRLNLNSKNWAVFEGSPFELDTESVPRVGEIVDVGTAFGLTERDVTTFIVLDLTWSNEDGTLIPTLNCHQWLDGDRKLELEESGWL